MDVWRRDGEYVHSGTRDKACAARAEESDEARPPLSKLSDPKAQYRGILKQLLSSQSTQLTGDE